MERIVFAPEEEEEETCPVAASRSEDREEQR